VGSSGKSVGGESLGDARMGGEKGKRGGGKEPIKGCLGVANKKDQKTGKNLKGTHPQKPRKPACPTSPCRAPRGEQFFGKKEITLHRKGGGELIKKGKRKGAHRQKKVLKGREPTTRKAKEKSSRPRAGSRFL